MLFKRATPLTERELNILLDAEVDRLLRMGAVKPLLRLDDGDPPSEEHLLVNLAEVFDAGSRVIQAEGRHVLYLWHKGLPRAGYGIVSRAGAAVELAVHPTLKAALLDLADCAEDCIAHWPSERFVREEDNDND
jgi:hypothetical protein